MQHEGIIWRSRHIKVLSPFFDQKCRKYIVDEMKRSARNIKPVVVLDLEKNNAKAYMINEDYTDLEEYDDLILCRKLALDIPYESKRLEIQQSDLSNDDKEVICEAVYIKNKKHEKLKPNDKDDLKYALKHTDSKSKFNQVIKKVNLEQEI
jgi:hypothetical protein